MAACPQCGRENPEGARFCNACGAEIALATTARDVRKTVTVVFSDVTGSTALGEKLDPESLRRVMGRYFDAMQVVLERHGGTVEKFIGDAVMAVFGIPVLHEDDALRAVRAAAEMRGRLGTLNEDLERDYGVRIACRIGVNTGEVVAGESRTLATGDAVNVAARLEQAAGPGEVLLGEATYRLVRAAVQAELLPPLDVKGKEEPLTAYRLVDVLSETPSRRLDSPMVGRERERRRLRDAFEQAAADRSCQLFSVLGAAGVGKSRLVHEVLRDFEKRATVLRGRCLSYGEGITFWPLVEVFREAGAEDELDAALDTTSPEETFARVRVALGRLTAEQPLVVVFDDVHWGEPTFLDLVEHIADWSRDAPILLVCLARPELLDSRPGWGGGKLNATSVLLEPLGKEEIRELVDNLLIGTTLPDDLFRRIADAAEGNPLFVEEMLAMVAEEGVNGELEVPPTIQALLAARLDRLPPPERSVIECASVEGKVFHRSALVELCPEELRSELGAHLMALVRKELVRPHEPELGGEDAFRFRHLLVRDAAYEALPKETRADLHERFAGWLERAAVERVAEYEEILGYHLEQAYRYRAELGPVDEPGRQLGTRGAALLARAGRRATARRDVLAGANLLERAVSLLEPIDPLALELMTDLGYALFFVGQLGRADEVLSAAVEKAAVADDRRLELLARIGRAYILLHTDPEGRGEELRRTAEEAIPVFEALGDDAGLARAWEAIGQVHHMACRFGPRAEAHERALHYARQAGDGRVEADCLGYLAGALQFGPAPVSEAIPRVRSIAEESSRKPAVHAVCLSHLAVLEAMGGHFDEARRLGADARAHAEEIGELMSTTAHLAEKFFIVEMLAGDAAAAEREIRRGFELLERAGERGWLSTQAAEVAQALYGQGRHEEAERYTEVSEEAGASDDVVTQVMWRQVRAKVLATRGELETAERLGLEAVDLADTSDSLTWRGDARMDLAEVLRLAGRPQEAAAAARQALSLYEQKGNIVMAGRARAVLDELAVTPR